MTSDATFVASDGVRLFYRFDDHTDPWKDAPYLVLVHPGMGGSERLIAWVPHFSRHYRVVRPDMRGHGKSEAGLDKPLTHERLGLDFVELLDHVGARKAHVMGSSAGGMVAMQAAFRWPERFASLALYAATAGIHPDRPKKGNWLERVAKRGVRQFLTETVRDRIGNASPEHVRWYIDSAEGVTVEALARFVPLMASEYYPEKLAQFKFPVLMVVPDPDPMVDRSEYDKMHRHLRDGTFVTIPGAGHGMTAEIPDRCAETLRDYLKKLETR
ncbi:MAG: alpha/beta hydrolase [Betaproteobacteria bacterium]|nr:alpha/beta hydrolase [Betaproteobacteria bacterium]